MQRVLTALIVALMLSACGTIEKEKKSQSLHNATRFYEHALRWGDYEQASALRNPQATMPSPDPASLTKFRITSYQVVSTYTSEDGMTVNQIVDIHYYNEDNLREKKLTDRQQWVYEPESQAWHLDSPLPSFR